MSSVLISALLHWVSLDAPCSASELLPITQEISGPFLVTRYSAIVDGRTYELIEPTYLPHGGTFVHSFWIDGERQWPHMNVENIKTNGAPTPRICDEVRPPATPWAEVT